MSPPTSSTLHGRLASPLRRRCLLYVSAPHLCPPPACACYAWRCRHALVFATAVLHSHLELSLAAYYAQKFVRPRAPGRLSKARARQRSNARGAGASIAAGVL